MAVSQLSKIASFWYSIQLVAPRKKFCYKILMVFVKKTIDVPARYDSIVFRFLGANLELIGMKFDGHIARSAREYENSSNRTCFLLHAV